MLFDVSRNHPTPIPAQIANAIRQEVAAGRFQPGDEVPSTRVLASQLGVSRGSVVTAYDQLISEGYLLARQGAPTQVHPELTVAASAGASPVKAPKENPRATLSLKPSPGNAGTIRPAAWRKAWREAAGQPGGGVDKAGEPELRAAIAEHLRLSRGMTVDPENVIVTGGSREGLLLILLALGTNLRVGVEDPGHPGLRHVIPLGGHRVVECATDGAGVVVEQLSEDLDALLVTPSHLYPVGGAMPAARRGELLDWAARTNTVLIEDDFNSELRYRLSPQPTLSTLAPDAQVLTLGTFSTLLSRELAAGYVVAPRGLADQLRGVRQVLGMPVSAVTQRAIANLLQGGVVRRTTRTVHLRLAKRRERLEKDLFPALGHLDCEVQLSNTGGADLTVRFPSEVVQQRFEDSLLRLGVECGHKAALWSDGGSGLVLSFAHLSDGDFERALRAVVSAEAEQRMSAEDSQHRQ